MSRFAVILLPAFPLQAALRVAGDPSTPVALLDDAGAISLATGAAVALGIEPGMMPAQAQARCAALRWVRRNLAQEAAGNAALAQAAASITPWWEATLPGAATLDLSRRAHPAAMRWGPRMVVRLAEAGWTARVGASGDPDAALRLALLADADAPVREEARLADAVGELPLGELDTTPTLARVLSGWGIHTAGELLALPRQAVGERLGAEGRELWDRAAGRTGRPLRWARAPEEYRERAEFEPPLETLEPLLFALRRMIGHLAARLRGAWRLVGALDLRLEWEDRALPPRERRLGAAAPTGDPELLFRLAHRWLDAVRAPAPLAACEVRAEPADPRDFQRSLPDESRMEPPRNPAALGETLDLLRAFVGDDRVGTPIPLDTFRPDRWRMEAWDFSEEAPPTFAPTPPCTPPSPASAAPLPSTLNHQPSTSAASRLSTLNSQPSTSPSPIPLGPALRRFRPPPRARVLVVDGLPAVVMGAGRWNGELVAARGPWPKSGHWWDPAQTWAWEEWDAQREDGILLRLAAWRDGWWVLGVYD